jgi:hypothetical protein
VDVNQAVGKDTARIPLSKLESNLFNGSCKLIFNVRASSPGNVLAALFRLFFIPLGALAVRPIAAIRS